MTELKSHSSCNSENIGYRVEARVRKINTHRPKMCNGHILSTEWTEVSLDRCRESVAGASITLNCHDIFDGSIMDYEAAMALAYFILHCHGFCSDTEVRILRYKVIKTLVVYRLGVVEGGPISERFERDLPLIPETAKEEEK